MKKILFLFALVLLAVLTAVGTLTMSSAYAQNVECGDNQIQIDGVCQDITCEPNQIWQNNECQDVTSTPKNNLNLHTDKVLYDQGDVVMIIGLIPNIENLDSGDVSIIVRSPDNNIVTITLVHPNANGSFQTSLKVDGPQFMQAGDYTILANFSGLKSQITFEFTGGNGGIISDGNLQMANSIVVFTDKTSYKDGDAILVIGKVSTIISDTPITIQIFNQGNLVDVAQITVATDGSYSYTIIAESPKLPKAGDYTIRASYEEGNVAETQFNFSLKSGVSTSYIFEVDAGSYGTLDVNYSINGGVVKNMLIDKDTLSLTTVIESTDNGSISLEIPRKAFDAKKQDQTDV